jgi:hypothetical protein
MVVPVGTMASSLLENTAACLLGPDAHPNVLVVAVIVVAIYSAVILAVVALCLLHSRWPIYIRIHNEDGTLTWVRRRRSIASIRSIESVRSEDVRAWVESLPTNVKFHNHQTPKGARFNNSVLGRNITERDISIVSELPSNHPGVNQLRKERLERKLQLERNQQMIRTIPKYNPDDAKYTPVVRSLKNQKNCGENRLRSLLYLALRSKPVRGFESRTKRTVFVVLLNSVLAYRHSLSATS